MGEWREGLPGDMPCMRGEGPETCGELGQVPVLWLGDTMGYGELGSNAPTVQSEYRLKSTNIYFTLSDT